MKPYLICGSCRLRRLNLVLHPDPVLRTVCPPVGVFDSTLRDLVQEMFELMQAHGGIGLAGPQVAVEQRVFVALLGGRYLCLTNPVVQDKDEPGEFLEACLSLPGVRVKVLRPERLHVTGYNQCGRRVSLGATGLWARVIQHELDHLNGVLILDRGNPTGETCVQPISRLPAVLLDESKRRSRPLARRPTRLAHEPRLPPPPAPTAARP